MGFLLHKGVMRWEDTMSYVAGIPSRVEGVRLFPLDVTDEVLGSLVSYLLYHDTRISLF